MEIFPLVLELWYFHKGFTLYEVYKNEELEDLLSKTIHQAFSTSFQETIKQSAVPLYEEHLFFFSPNLLKNDNMWLQMEIT